MPGQGEVFGHTHVGMWVHLSVPQNGLNYFTIFQFLGQVCWQHLTLQICLCIIYTESQKKTGPLLFEHSFGKYCPILIILSLLQTEINYDNVYHKIYHRTSNLLVHYLVK